MKQAKQSTTKGAAPRLGPTIRLSRAYDAPPKRHAYRVLIDRVWPRVVKKEDLALNAWLKHLAPSTELRRWFNHRPEKWSEFRRRYFRELDLQPEAVCELAAIAAKRDLTLVFAAALREHLLHKLRRRTSP